MPRTTSRPDSESFFPETFEDRALFVENFDATPFQFRHCLHCHPAFQLGAIHAVAERLAVGRDKKSHPKSGEPRYKASTAALSDETTQAEALAGMVNGENSDVLEGIQKDEVYREILCDIVPELSKLSGVDLAKVYYDPTMTIFVTPPGRITPYHMDCETNFRAQLYGEEMAYVYNGDDASVLSQEDLEMYWTGKLPKIDWPPALSHGHWQYKLVPGSGMFSPACFPNWLQHGDGVSVSVSINFKRRHNAATGAHRMNHYLRKLGLNPRAPGQSLSLDRAKEAIFGRLYAGAETMRKRRKGKGPGR